MSFKIKHFIIASVLVHAALLVVWSGAQSYALRIPFSDASAPSFDVTFSTDTKPVAAAKRHSSVIPNDTPKQKPTVTPPPQLAKQNTADTADTTSTPTTHASNPHQAELQRSEVRDRVLSRIRSNLQQYFIYPLLAQRQGWQGRVLLGFSVEADGMIHNIHIAAGSGYSILDTSAVDALSRVHHLYEASGWLQGTRLELQMPVIFRLQGG
jgi:protein TonB